MNYMKIVGVAALILLSPIIVIILWIAFAIVHGTTLRVLGYEVDKDPIELAQEIYDSEDSVKRCRNLRQAVPTMGPTNDAKIMRCVFEYASIAKDPLACEGLMPSDYGWNCLGAAEVAQPCIFNFISPKKVQGNGIDVPMDTCTNKNSSAWQNECCVIAREVHLGGNNSCDSLELPASFKDQCFYESAIRNIDFEVCSSISNENIRNGCEVGVRALIKRDDL